MIGLLALAGAALGLIGGSNPRMAVGPETVPLPPRYGSAQESRAYLGQDGSAVVGLLALTVDLPLHNSACRDLALRLDRIGAPNALAAAAAKAPELNLRDAAINHVGTVGRYLGACADGQDLTQAARDAQYSAVLLQRVIDRERAS